MKVLFYSSYFYPYTSGITTYPFKILSYMVKKHQITVLTFNHKNNRLEEEDINGFNIVRMPYLIKLYKGFISPQSLFFFIKELKKNDSVIINLPNVEGFILTFLAKVFGKKVISIFHCYLGLSNKFYLKIINSITNLIITLQLTLSDKIISYTDDYVSHLPIYKLIRNKTKTILPPILKLPITKTKFEEFKKIKGKKIWIGYAGRISQEKGLEYLIKAISLIRHSGLSRIVVVFAGPYGKDVVGENPYFLKIKKLLEENKINYRFFGNLINGDLGAFYKVIDLLVLPSTNRTEAFGMVQAEAMLTGTPVVASNLPGVRVPIKLTNMGKIVEPKNSELLSKALLEVLNNKSKFTNSKLVKNAQEIFDIKKVYKFYKNLISSEI
ncbi:hypothetical protein COY13_01635 [Candidatus Roizmanbacteria bacterium CG_4_10_14_0_2_um_filter_36_35]|uniref:Glycosyl transferase family 1 domain-containing protein n=4 Tax=Candidatus Roizmaniibacteriota TaxID=1752723 RepID=A0A2M7BWM3_9BACT|nr:MAG: hypothetical protein COV86_03795 [Candidatus Roizmanbacteria bacterium CG11_big_fil_rev_8_21_14_0_20_35_14]PIV10982.1 MAG: hypothetical protein COS50_02560 [Candidatus Roizmanbacteria bacterium CG03_land_8_20_14_0_80_35_26]PIZ68203.1 MAG: hypothetical protein COY13_01635 [Candidatus Roizmanbacteria bacterium CG_4_10_14_0_2_um_filter_36_35]PJC31007.1 MAG: hypothetical protein CO049_04710 [Candidatus Roizmanbacteria bacterium CG_4_9_14_0_2_um_filter_36_12]